MSKVAIVTDSTAYIPQELIDKYKIEVGPQVLIWGEETFQDGVDIMPAEFYKRLETAKVMPTTSQVTIGTFKEIFERLLAEDFPILCILLSSKLSGTIDSAIQARDMFPGASIEIVDSKTTAMALGFQVLTVARAAEKGASLEECKELAEQATNHTGVVFAVDTLEFLHRGGRIGGGKRFLGTALKIKPILEVTGGQVEAVEQVRTRQKSLQRIVEMIEERTSGEKPIRLATLHGNAEDVARQVLDMACEKIQTEECLLSEVSPAIGTHAGPGVVGLCYMAGM